MTERELNKIVSNHLPLARKVATYWANYFKMEYDDVFEFALWYLAKAAREWKPDSGRSFGQYAKQFLVYNVRNKCISKVKQHRKHAAEPPKEPYTPMLDLDHILPGNPELKGAPESIHSAVADAKPDCYCAHARRQAWNVIASMLDTREFMILAYHFGLEPLPKLTQTQIGQRLHISKQRVSVIEWNAITKIKRAYSTEDGRAALEALREYVVAKVV